MDRSQAAVLFFITAFLASTIGGEIYAAGPCVVGGQILLMAQASPSEAEGSEAGSEGGAPTLPGQPAPETNLQVLEQTEREVRAAIAHNQANLLKIPHVVGIIPLGDAEHPGNDLIVVEVDDPENVGEVERKVPSTLEGFEVRVGSGVGHGEDL
ncbi:MAG: hypothetical protein ACLQDV_02180 [Candidatus Binataceae bacterium]